MTFFVVNNRHKQSPNMGKLILYSAISLDAYIAKPNGSVEWLHDPGFHIEGEDFGYKAFYESVGTTLMGNNTYREILNMDIPFPYPDTDNYVFSRFKDTKDTEYVQFAKGKIRDFVPKIKAETKKDIWLIGGAQINGILLKEGLIDQLILTIVPVILGKGIPLFSGEDLGSKWKLKQSKAYDNSFVQVVYDYIGN